MARLTRDITKEVLEERYQEAYEGSLTTKQVVRAVRAVNKDAKKVGIHKAIENYGPIGVGDDAWRDSAAKKQIKPRFYDPKTGRPLDV